MNFKESISLQPLHNQSGIAKEENLSTQLTSFIDGKQENYGDYEELYPDLRLTKEEAKDRAKQFKSIKKKQKLENVSSSNQLFKKLNIWKPVNKVISLRHETEAVAYFKLNRWMTLHLIIIFVLVVTLLIIPVSIFYYGTHNLTLESYNDLLPNNENWLIDMPIFYGFYNITRFSKTKYNYSLSRAFYWVNVITRVFYLLFILKKLITNISLTYATESNLKILIRPSQLLGIWDYRSQSDQDNSSSKTVVRDLVKKVMTKTNVKSQVDIATNILVNVISYITIGLVLERISLILSLDQVFIEGGSGTYQWLITPLIIALALLCLTWIFDVAQHLEKYERDYIKLLTTLARIVILNLSVLILILYHYTALISCARNSNPSATLIRCNLMRNTVDLKRQSLLFKCWETWIGQKILAIIIIYIILSFAIYLVLDVGKLIIKYSDIRLIPTPKFFQRTIIGHMIFIDGLFWLGFYYCPGLPILYLFYLILSYFYHMNFISLSCTNRSCSVLSIKLHKTLFLLILTITTIVGSSCLIYHSYKFTTSRSCGPFSHLCHNYDSEDNSSLKEIGVVHLILRLVDMATGHNGLWYFGLTLILVFLIRNVFRIRALRELRRQMKLRRKQVTKDKLFLNDKWKPLKQKLRRNKSSYLCSRLEEEEAKKFYQEF